MARIWVRVGDLVPIELPISGPPLVARWPREGRGRCDLRPGEILEGLDLIVVMKDDLGGVADGHPVDKPGDRVAEISPHRADLASSRDRAPPLQEQLAETVVMALQEPHDPGAGRREGTGDLARGATDPRRHSRLATLQVQVDVHVAVTGGRAAGSSAAMAVQGAGSAGRRNW